MEVGMEIGMEIGMEVGNCHEVWLSSDSAKSFLLSLLTALSTDLP